MFGPTYLGSPLDTVEDSFSHSYFTMANLSASATIIIVLVCCACLAVIIAAVGRHYYGEAQDEEANYKTSPEQAEYMRSVQKRNASAMFPFNYQQRQSEKPSLQSRMTSYSEADYCRLRSEILGIEEPG